jgi:DNA-binding MarR family transcriptional regulator
MTRFYIEVAAGSDTMNSKALEHTVEVDIPSLCNCSKLRRAARRVSRFYDECLAPSGIKTTQFTILGHLKHRGPKTMLQLADLLSMDRATIGHNLRPLERDGLVSIETAEFDRRARVVKVTEKGLDLIATARPAWDRAQAEFEKAFGVEEARTMRVMMDSVVDSELRVVAAAE